MHAFYVLTVLEQMNPAEQHLFVWLHFIHHMHRAVYIPTVCYSYPNQNLIMVICLIGWDTKLFTLPNWRSSLYFKMLIKNTCSVLGTVYNVGPDHQLHPS